MPNRRTPIAIPILSYHQVTPEPHPAFRKYSLTPEEFLRQVQWLRRRGYETVDLAAIAAWQQGSGRLPRRPVVLTFDDGFEEVAVHAAPVLRAHGYTATFFVVSGLVGNRSAWLIAERGFDAPLMDWRTLAALRNDGFSVGSHAMTHPRLSALPIAECRTELVEARATLERHLGVGVDHLAYPFGIWSESVRSAAGDAGYATACTTEIALARRSDHPLSLPRVPVLGGESLRMFAWRLRFAHAPRDVARMTRARLAGRLGWPSRAVQ